MRENLGVERDGDVVGRAREVTCDRGLELGRRSRTLEVDSASSSSIEAGSSRFSVNPSPSARAVTSRALIPIDESIKCSRSHASTRAP
jgi:hypothetical protein